MNWRPIYLVARREVRERIRTRGFLVATALTLIGVLAIVGIAAVNSDDGPKTATVAAIGVQSKEAFRAVEGDHESLNLTIRASDSSLNEAEARQAILDGDIDAALTGDGVLVGDDAPDVLAPVLSQAQAEAGIRAELDDAGLGAGEIDSALSAGSAPVEVVSDAESDEGAGGIAFMATLLMYLAIISAGYTVASGVVEEKTSRVVELILGAVRPAQLLAGKVFGIGFVSLVQFGLIVLTGFIAAGLTGSIELPEATVNTAVLALIFFVLGYIFYGCAFATAGAIVSRQEDSQTSTTPLMILLVGGYLASFPVIDDPDSSLAVLLSFVPPVAPMIVPVRAATDSIPPEQLALSIALMIAGCAALIWAAGRIYERAILRMGAPLEIREVLGLLREQRETRS